MPSFLKSNYQIILIILLAVFCRFWQIGSLPAGLFPDEAANGLDVNSILKGDLQPFYERGNGREALFFYALALSVAIFGRSPFSHHIVSAAFGVLIVLTTYFLTKRLFGKNVALLASFLLAVSSFAVTISRTAFRANTLPLFATLTLLFIVKFVQSRGQRQKLASALCSGLFFGLGFYTYISSRMMVALALFVIVIVLVNYRDKMKNLLLANKKYLSSFIGAFAVAISWIGFYFFKHPEALFARVGHVSIFSKDLNHGDALGTFIEVFKKTLLSFFTEGDLNWRHNVSGFPFLPPIVAPFFAVALAIFSLAIFVVIYQALRKKIKPKVFYLALVGVWFWLMTVPEITTAEGIPHGLRLIGVIPAMFIMPAWAMHEFWVRLKAKTRIGKSSKLAYAAIVLSAIFVYNFSLYFGVAARSPDYYYAFRSDLTRVSEYIKSCAKNKMIYLALDKFSVQTIDYLTTGAKNQYYLLVPERAYEVTLNPGDKVIFTQSTLFDQALFLKYHPGADLIVEEKNKFGQVIMTVYEEQ
ncbi:MAG: glycosyltransferase family 39 protein [bacterium]|nr:glycosyltransferase family 39 protein [bacterium]